MGAIAGLIALSGCHSPIPFHTNPEETTPVLGLGGSAPYVRIGPAQPPPSSAAPAPRPRASHAANRGIDVYAYTRPGMFRPAVRRVPARVYVANSDGTTIVINPRTYRVVGRIPVGLTADYVIPSWDLRTLWVNDSGRDVLVPIDPRTGRRGRSVPVASPYNLQFTPDGRHALVTVARPPRIDVRDPHSMRLRRSIPLPCAATARADFAANGSYLVAGCAASGRLIRVDLRRGQPPQVLRLHPRAVPQDIRLSPDGTLFYVTDAANGGVWTINAARFRPTRFIRTGAGAHGLISSRDGTTLYVTNRAAGTISVLDFTTARVVRRWRLPGGGSPDMGGVSADGTVLWLSGRLHGVVYALSTRTGRLLHAIPAGRSPHGVCVFPQPGRHSLGHTYR
jgi:DNA-binding beta-propeller fold protein YncE